MTSAASASASLVMAVLVVVSARKCCRPGDILDHNLTCVIGSSHIFLDVPSEDALSCNGNISLVRPFQGMKINCLDVVDNLNFTSLKGVVCSDGGGKVEVPQVNFVRKCCPESRRYSDFREGCWGDHPNEVRSVELLRTMFLNDSDTPLELSVGVPKCPRGKVLVDIFIHHRHVWRQDSESILLKHQGPSDVLLVPEEFCVDLWTGDDYSLVIRACQDATVTCDRGTTPCINKCCRDGKAYKTFHCDNTKDTFDVQFYSVRPDKAPSPSSVSSVGIGYEDAFFKCRNGKFPLDPERSSDDFFLVTDSGDLLIPENPLHHNLIDWRDFCLERLGGRVVPFLCFPPVRTKETFHFKVIALGLLVSGVFLLITFLVYACLPSLHNLHGRTLMCHVASLLAAYAFLVCSQLMSSVLPKPLCTATSYGIQFFFLAAFSWLNVICFDIWWTFGAIKSHTAKAEESCRKFLWYSLYAWLVPLAITSVTFLVDNYKLVPQGILPNMGLRYCWFHRDTHGKTVFFNLPVMIQITTNVVFFALTIRNCSKIKSELQQMQNNSNAKLKYHADINKLAMNTKLFVVMGLTWGCEVITWYFQSGDNNYFWYLLDAANIFQGFFIFLIFVIKKKVIRAMKLRIHEVVPACFSEFPKHRPSTTSTVFTTVASSDARHGSQIHK
ncbi:G-protein coupled receptor Mth2-like [Macrosteles quadrilineatus]|uniref:G-protein coupled receptor Mth2-like n=1 Tax=Macrosteles quadrilineatus TaxID=74068 RepID=UPI0023E235E8|nr:G-protein coupled receptor Mth2-like [Macrosteles quadrilineatus]